MPNAYILFSSLLVMLSACSTNDHSLASRQKVVLPAQEEVGLTVQEDNVVGTYIGPTGTPMMKVCLEPNGTYVVGDIGPSEYITMMEGTRVYHERINFPPQRGHWTVESRTGQLTLTPETAGSFRFSTTRFRYDRNQPDRLSWGDHAYLVRQTNAAP
ncbi:MAG: hypothetical protein ACK4UN_15640 [Limisphaerales bacterium]